MSLALKLAAAMGGASSAPVNTYGTWNAGRAGAGISLSNGDLTATKNAVGWNSVFADGVVTAKSSGKWYWEITSDFISGSLGAMIGFGNVSTSPESYLGGAGGICAGFRCDSSWFYSGVTVHGTNSGAYAAGDVLCCCLDLDNKKFWVGKNGSYTGSLAGDPASGLNPAITWVGGPILAPAVSLYTSPEQWTGNFGATPFAYSVPAGFEAGWTTPYVPPPPPGSGYRYLRLLEDDGVAGVLYGALTEVYWMVGGTAYPTAPMTSNTAPAPLVATASSEYNSSYAPYTAFDRNPSTYQNPSVNNDQSWLTIDLGAGNEITPTAIRITPYAGYWLRAFRCYGSNTGAFAGEETLLYTYNGGDAGWSASNVREFVF